MKHYKRAFHSKQYPSRSQHLYHHLKRHLMLQMYNAVKQKPSPYKRKTDGAKGGLMERGISNSNGVTACTRGARLSCSARDRHFITNITSAWQHARQMATVWRRLADLDAFRRQYSRAHDKAAQLAAHFYSALHYIRLALARRTILYADREQCSNRSRNLFTLPFFLLIAHLLARRLPPRENGHADRERRRARCGFLSRLLSFFFISLDFLQGFGGKAESVGNEMLDEFI